MERDRMKSLEKRGVWCGVEKLKMKMPAGETCDNEGESAEKKK
jgi:hypothetical protein